MQASLMQFADPALDIPLKAEYGVEQVTVTPQIAEHWLGFNVANRTVTKAKLAQFKDDMARGEWRPQGDTIRFSHGKLLDGQHRLVALLLAGVTLPMLVVHGLAPETQANMDTGRGRSPRDVLSIEGLDTWEASTFGSAVHTILSYERGLAIYSATKYLNREVRDFYLENKPDVESTLHACKGFKRQHTIVPLSRVVALHYILSKIDRDATTRFFDQLLSGESLLRSSPVFYLRERMLNDLINKRKRSVYEQCLFIVKTWNAVRRGAAPKSESFMRSKLGEPFPEIAT